ncbi:MAG: TniQ family protein, partial [Cyanobacteria bacterium P01_H01_bin.153]
MITCFPHLYPDELFYSACARYVDRVQYSTDKAVIEELFGSRTATATISFPSHLTHLIANLPPGHRHTVDRLIDHHSLLPFFSPFLQPEKVDRIREDMQGS